MIPNIMKNLISKVQEKSPLLLVIGGSVCLVGAIASAISATVKSKEVLEKFEKEAKGLKETKDLMDKSPNKTIVFDNDEPDFTIKDYREYRAEIYTRLFKGCAKNYILPLTLTVTSVVMFCSSYGILSKRYAGATAALSAVTEAFGKYRGRVKELIGDAEEERLYRGEKLIRKAKDTGLVDAEGNPIVEVEESVNIDTANGIPPYAKFFDESNPNWTKNSEMNLLFLTRKQDQANDLLKRKMNGVLTLNEVYRILDLPETVMGSEVGWCWTRGDEFVDFGIYSQCKAWASGNERARRFVNGEENVILLDFNCVPIKDKLPKV